MLAGALVLFALGVPNCFLYSVYKSRVLPIATVDASIATEGI